MTNPQPCGTRAAYARHRNNGEDPCDPCRLANAEVSRSRRERLRQLWHEGKVNPTHGKPSTYGNYGCRCDPCTEAHRVHVATYRKANRQETAT